MKNISFSTFAGYYHYAGQCRGKGEREACQERGFFNPGRNLIGDISIARWLQWYQDPSKPKLNIDPYLCGTVRTHSSNAPIGDRSYYIMLRGRTAEPYGLCIPYRRTTVITISTRPCSGPCLPTAYHRIGGWQDVAGQSYRIGFTCEFHATPADCSAHS